jgi:hypothetical protein
VVHEEVLRKHERQFLTALTAVGRARRVTGAAGTRRVGRAGLGAVAAAGAVALTTITTPSLASDAAACTESDTDYAIVAHVLVRNTAFGAANGEYLLGSGTLRLRVEGAGDSQRVTLRSFDLANHLTVVVRAAVVSGQIVTTAHTTVSHDASGNSAVGTQRGPVITWATPVSGYRSDGTMECSGSACGKFGGPPKGVSPFHDAPPAVTFTPFTFSADRSTFTMPYTLLSKADSPRQTTYLSIAGRLVHRTCTPPAAP